MDSNEKLRYARHLSLPNFGLETQEKLRKSSVLIVGAGGLGCPAALYLVAAGVGKITILDDDKVELSNLQRQILHDTNKVGEPKSFSAKERLKNINPHVEVIAMNERFSVDNAREILKKVDIVLDGTDNFPTRYLINDAAFLEKKTVIHGSIYLYEGQVTVFDPPNGPCYRCLFPNPPKPGSVPSCSEAGVLGVLPGVIGVLQATETIKYLTQKGEGLIGRLLTYDALSMSFQNLNIKPNKKCSLCGENPTITEAREINWSCEVPEEESIKNIDVFELKGMGLMNIDFYLLDVRNSNEVENGKIEGSINIPLSELKENLSKLSDWKNKKIICQCQSGVRSLKATNILLKNNFSDVYNLEGGYMAWLDANYRPR